MAERLGRLKSIKARQRSAGSQGGNSDSASVSTVPTVARPHVPRNPDGTAIATLNGNDRHARRPGVAWGPSQSHCGVLFSAYTPSVSTAVPRLSVIAPLVSPSQFRRRPVPVGARAPARERVRARPHRQ